MAVQEIPKSYRYTCDLCGEEHVQTNANGPYTNSTPPDWMRLKVSGNGRRWSYPAEPLDKLFCEGCGELTLQAIERVEPAENGPKKKPGMMS